jgi:hypothetical protein
MATVKICDICDERCYGDGVQWGINANLRHHMTSKTYDICHKCWPEVSALVIDLELEKKHGTARE